MKTCEDLICPYCSAIVEEFSIRQYTNVPDSCVCYRNWDLDDIDPVCDSYQEDPRSKGQCKNCCHDKECHA